MGISKADLIRQLIKNTYFFLLPLSSSRAKYIKKHNVFASCGKNLFWQPRKLPSDPKCIKIHDNVVIAADVTFINHDVIYILLNQMSGEKDYKQNLSCIEVMDNVFIGLGAKILPGVKIGPNAIIAAGSIVTKDVPPFSVVAGVPARVIGSFDEIELKQRELSKAVIVNNRFDQKRIDQAWEMFDSIHSAENSKKGQ